MKNDKIDTIPEGLKYSIRDQFSIILYAFLRVLTNKKIFRDKKELLREIIDDIEKNKEMYISSSGESFKERKEKTVEKVLTRLKALKDGKINIYEPFNKIYTIFRLTNIITLDNVGRILSNIYGLQQVVILPTDTNIAKNMDYYQKMLWEHSAKLLGLITDIDYYFIEKDEIFNIPKEYEKYFIQHLERSTNERYRELLKLYNDTANIMFDLERTKARIYMEYEKHINDILEEISISYASKATIYKNNVKEAPFMFVIDYNDSLDYITRELLRTENGKINLGAFVLAESSDESIIKRLKDDIILLLSKAYEIKVKLREEIEEYYKKRQEYLEKLKNIQKIVREIKTRVKLGDILDGYCDICKVYKTSLEGSQEVKNDEK